MGIPSRRTVRREPVGVVAAITPWNVPTQINLAKVGPALAAGCTVVLKPAPDTPWLACELGRLVAEHTDIPAGVFNVVTPRSNEVAARADHRPAGRHGLVHRLDRDRPGDHGRRRADAEEGLPRARRQVRRDRARRRRRRRGRRRDGVRRAASTPARAARSPPGWSCPRERYDEAVQVAAATMESIGAKDPADPGAICGPVISQVQRDRVEAYLRLAEEEGGTFATGGHVIDQAGFWIEPTVVAGLDNSSRLAQEEIFGPVLVVIPHDGDDDAVRIANDSAYGLSGLGRLRRPRAREGRRRAGSAPAPSPSTAASGSARTRRSAATSSPASAARWAWPASRSTSRPRPIGRSRA